MADKKNKTDASAKATKARGGGKTPKGKAGAKKAVIALPDGYKPRLQILYKEKVVKELKKQFEIKNPMLIPRLDKVVLNIGMGTLHSSSATSLCFPGGRR